MKKRIIRIGVLLLASVLLAVLLEFLQIRTQPPVYESEPRVIQEAEALNYAQAELTNATLSDDNIKTGGEGTVILFRLQPAKTLSFLTFESKKHIRNGFPIRVSLSRDGETFADSDTVEIEAVPEAVTWTAKFPESEYAAVKIELNNKVTLRPVRYRDEVTEKVAVPEQMRLWRIGILIPVLFLIMVLLCWFKAGSRLAETVRKCILSLKEAGRKVPVRILFFLLVSFVVYVIIRWLVSGAFFGAVNVPKQMFCILAGLAAGLLLAFPKTLGAKPENLFVLFCLLSGWMILFLFPNHAYVNWDAEYHFEQTHIYSYLGEERLTDPDMEFIGMDNTANDRFSWEDTLRTWQSQQERYLNGASEVKYSGLMLNSIYDIFPAAGMYLGRVLHMTWPWTLYMAKLFNLLTSALCGFFAIRRLKSGKMILACVLLIPTNVFLASVFSYDHGVISFMALGLSYFFAEWQEPEKKLTWRNAFVILGSLTFACLTKAFYAPALFFTLFMPRGKWAADSQGRREYITRKAYVLLTLLAFLISLLPYIIPLLSGNVVTDMRGGSSDAPMEQIRFILSDPLRYLRNMFSFQRSYFSPEKSSGLLTFFAYQGMGPGWLVIYILLAVLAFTDKKPCDLALERKPLIRIIGLFLFYLSTCIICFCLFITFTDVGADLFDGVQPRYLLPIVYPVLMLVGSGLVAKLLNIDKDWKQRLYNGAAFLVSLIVLFNVIYTTCISKFT